MTAAACAVSLLVPVSAQAGPGISRAPASAELVTCQAGSQERPGAYAEFRGTMVAKGARRMEMRFTVLARGNRDTVFTPISAPGLGTWRAAERGVARYRVNQVVNNLTSGTAYRAVIDFRWRNAAGRVIRTLTRRTPQCAVDARPDLSLVDSVPRRSERPGMVNYVVTVENRGAAAARNVTIELRYDNEVQGEVRLDIGAFSRARAVFVAPRCTEGSLVEAIIDPDGSIPDSDLTNNQLTMPCSGLAAGRARVFSTLAGP